MLDNEYKSELESAIKADLLPQLKLNQSMTIVPSSRIVFAIRKRTADAKETEGARKQAAQGTTPSNQVTDERKIQVVKQRAKETSVAKARVDQSRCAVLGLFFVILFVFSGLIKIFLWRNCCLSLPGCVCVSIFIYVIIF